MFQCLAEPTTLTVMSLVGLGFPYPVTSFYDTTNEQNMP
jgi:hypothetical protein